MNNEKVPLAGGAVTAEIIKPGADVIRMVQAQSTQWTMFKDVLQNNSRTVTLYDDGNHNDYKAGDGIFGGLFRETDKKGAYLVNATIRRQKQNGDPVEKQITGSFQVGPIADNPITSSQSLRYTRDAKRHFQRPNPTQQQLETAEPIESIEQLENSADPLESIDQLNGSDPLESIDNLMK
ncbi:choice-of-anchor X domain-containing protein [Thiolapillus sp.]|uniref:choice-of-anchor X domain-containing protein n=3 Tax=Thiolapillus sp. TaxID=2017437 RepID=UPI0025F8DD25|nr:choice-of-anchor X domain-containing protein [Thiolapillus sp.]